MKANYCLEFEVAGLPKMMNGSHGSIHAAAGERSKWRRIVKSKVLSFPNRPKKPLECALLSLTRCSSRRPDYDGLVAGFKSVIDGLKDAGLIVDDKYENIGYPMYNWEKAANKEGKIRVTIEETDAIRRLFCRSCGSEL